MGLFAGIEKAKGTEGGNYIIPGNHVLLIEKCKEGKTRRSEDFFVADCRILKSNTMEVGSSASFFVKFDPAYPGMALGNVSDFDNAALQSYFNQNNIDAPENFFPISEATADEVVSEENILAGTVVKCEAYNKDTKAGNPFTRFRWTPVKDAVEAAEYL